MFLRFPPLKFTLAKKLSDKDRHPSPSCTLQKDAGIYRGKTSLYKAVSRKKERRRRIRIARKRPVWLFRRMSRSRPQPSPTFSELGAHPLVMTEVEVGPDASTLYGVRAHDAMYARTTNATIVAAANSVADYSRNT